MRGTFGSPAMYVSGLEDIDRDHPGHIGDAAVKVGEDEVMVAGVRTLEPHVFPLKDRRRLCMMGVQCT